ncbi:MAG: DNA-binding protein [Methanomassiliicoccales archaeon]|nr:MAG: DNA-binding protein [Methanomassiliicoccales archaeon]
MEEEDELEVIRKKKLEELQLQSQQQAAFEEQQRLMEAQRQTIMRQILTPKARERLGRLKTARPELVQAIEEQLIALARAGRVVGQIDDDELRKLLSKLTPKKREIKIERR